MMSARRPLVSATAFVLALAFTALIVHAPPADASTAQAEQSFLSAINAERRSRGLGQLQANSQLAGVARTWSASMASSGQLAHNPSLTSQVTGSWVRLGENVGFTRQSGATLDQLVSRLHEAFMNSTNHRANVLGSYNQAGIGVAIAADGALWATQVFMHGPLTTSLPARAVHVVGDWDGDGQTSPGWFLDGVWHLRESNSAGVADRVFTYGRRGDLPVVGDWNGDGKTTVGIVRDGTWHLKNSNGSGMSDVSFHYGRVTRGDLPVTGDWDGNGYTTVGIVRDGQWHLKNRLAGGSADIPAFTYGRLTRGDLAVTGDWNSDGVTTVGILRDGEWHLKNSHRGGGADQSFVFGRVTRGDSPVTGDWDGDGKTTVGVVRAGTWHQRDDNAGGFAHRSFVYMP